MSCHAKNCDKRGIKKCSRCGKARYCSVECQRKCWKEHKKVCKKKTRNVTMVEKDGLVYMNIGGFKDLRSTKADDVITNDFHDKHGLRMLEIIKTYRNQIEKYAKESKRCFLFVNEKTNKPVTGIYLSTSKVVKCAKNDKRFMKYVRRYEHGQMIPLYYLSSTRFQAVVINLSWVSHEKIMKTVLDDF